MKLFNKKNTNLPIRRTTTLNTESASKVFTRNRTITGTTSRRLDGGLVGDDPVSSRRHAHRLTIVRRKAGTVLLIVILSVIFIWFVISSFTASVAVGTSDAAISKPVDKARYEKVIQEYLDTNPMQRFSFVQDQELLSEYVSNKLPEVKKVENNSTFIGRTNFLVTMRQPVAGWQIDDKQYYVDSEGIPFELNYFSGAIVQISDNTGVKIKQGSSAVASRRFLGFVGRVVYSAKQSGYTVIKAILPANTTRELDINIKDINYYVKLSIDRPAGEQVQDMINSIVYLDKRFSPIYLDVRVSGKAFYK